MYILLDTACSTTVDSGACLINHIKKKQYTSHFQASPIFRTIAVHIFSSRPAFLLPVEVHSYTDPY